MPSEHAEALALAQNVIAWDTRGHRVTKDELLLARAVVALAAERDAAVQRAADLSRAYDVLEADADWEAKDAGQCACRWQVRADHRVQLAECAIHAALRERAEQAEAERDAALRTVAERDARIAVLEAQLATLRRWMAEYPSDKYTGAWWLAELDRITALAPAAKGGA